ncbi:hypothetical protein ACRALDRAFT_205377 [Sodiomyces alcalophilus JCM 7366]|uniref:uncharacterized protein n=1 Tax=Sodiomyces alcalophilus JCM 7366 TaxID=591952 RepID=UPI0039B6601E
MGYMKPQDMRVVFGLRREVGGHSRTPALLSDRILHPVPSFVSRESNGAVPHSLTTYPSHVTTNAYLVCHGCRSVRSRDIGKSCLRFRSPFQMVAKQARHASMVDPHLQDLERLDAHKAILPVHCRESSCPARDFMSLESSAVLP